tara:strand:- start:738 stop:2192 length:1455 start_codon:yes stop_codon:yes gene_type:complete
MHYFDIIIVIFYLSMIFGVGLYSRRYVENFSSFMVAGRNVGLSLSVVTMLGTELGLITVMYNAQTGVNGLFASFHIGLAAFIVTLLIGTTGFVIVRLRSLKVKSIPEYYNIRFGRNVRILGAILLCLGGILNMGLFLKVGAIFIQTIFGFNDGTILFIMSFLIVLVLIYTISGGMISVIITDYIQYVVLSIGFFISIYFSIKYLGWSNLFVELEKIASNSSKNIYDPVENKGVFYISWQVILGFVSAVIWPTAITRALAIKKVELVKKQYIWSSFSFLIRFIMPCFLGICAYVYFEGNLMDNTLVLFPKYLSEILPVGALGLVVAGMLAAFMSTHDSYLLCWSSIITNDIIEPISSEKLSSDKKIYITRIIILLLGLYVFIWGMLYEGSDAIWDYLGITGAVYFTGAISVIVAGLYWEKASSTGAVLALLAGFSAIVGLEPIRYELGININNPSIIGLFTLFFSMFLMIVGSLFFPDNIKSKGV